MYSVTCWVPRFYCFNSFAMENEESANKGEKQSGGHFIEHFKKWNEWYRVLGEGRGFKMGKMGSPLETTRRSLVLPAEILK